MTTDAPPAKPTSLQAWIAMVALACGIPAMAICAVSAMQNISTELYVTTAALAGRDLADADHWLASPLIHDAYPGVTELKATRGGRYSYLICADGDAGKRAFIGEVGTGAASFDLRDVSPLELRQTQSLCS